MDLEVKIKLETLADICHDGAQGYDSAAEHLSDDELATLYRRLAQQRRLFVQQLKEEARRLGAHFQHAGTLSGDLHRNWLELKSVFGEESDAKIIEHALTGEEAALETYDEVIDEKIPDYLTEKLLKQRQLIAGAIEQLETIQQQMNKAA